MQRGRGRPAICLFCDRYLSVLSALLQRYCVGRIHRRAWRPTPARQRRLNGVCHLSGCSEFKLCVAMCRFLLEKALQLRRMSPLMGRSMVDAALTSCSARNSGTMANPAPERARQQSACASFTLRCGDGFRVIGRFPLRLNSVARWVSQGAPIPTGRSAKPKQCGA